MQCLYKVTVNYLALKYSNADVLQNVRILQDNITTIWHTWLHLVKAVHCNNHWLKKILQNGNFYIGTVIDLTYHCLFIPSDGAVGFISWSYESLLSEKVLTLVPSSISCKPNAKAAARLFPISCTTLAAACNTGREKLRNELSNLKVHKWPVHDKFHEWQVCRRTS